MPWCQVGAQASFELCEVKRSALRRQSLFGVGWREGVGVGLQLGWVNCYEKMLKSVRTKREQQLRFEKMKGHFPNAEGFLFFDFKRYCGLEMMVCTTNFLSDSFI